jgi:hypothetical protein
VSGVTSIATGEPVQIQETDDRSLIGAGANFDVPNAANNGSPIYVNRNPRNRQHLPYFNPSYFVPETLGQVGDIQRRFFHRPGLDNYNMALLKETEIAGEKKLQFRAEAFNVFNHAQFNNPGDSSSPGGGNKSSAGRLRLCNVRPGPANPAGCLEVFVLVAAGALFV